MFTSEKMWNTLTNKLMGESMSEHKIGSDGFTLIELIVVIAILAIIALIVVPRLTGLGSVVEENVCASNRKTVEGIYSAYSLVNEHGESSFNQFIIENFVVICPSNGVINYVDGEVKCNLHKEVSESGEDEPPGEEVPWL